MSLFQKLKSLFLEKKKAITTDTKSVVRIWLDDVCQIQLIPAENESEIRLLFNHIIEKTSPSKTSYGHTQILERGEFSIPLSVRKISQFEIEELFDKHNIEQSEYIERELSVKLPYTHSADKAYQCTYEFFFDLKGGSINQFWLKERLISSIPDFIKIEQFLNELAQEHNLILVNWNSLEISDIRDKGTLKELLMLMYK